MGERQPVRTALYDKHVALEGKIVEFCGYMMPVQYPMGIIKEHEQVRTQCGMFDLSHMGEFEVSGEGADEAVRRLITNDSLKLVDGQILYTPMCYDNGTIVDDLLVYRYSKDKWMLVVNAANIDKDEEWVKKQLPDNLTFVNRSEDVSLIALQGPEAAAVLGAFVPVDEIEPFHFIETQISEHHVLVSRTGYTGEDGFELYTGAKEAQALWDVFIRDERVKPIGLGARDTLRFEAKLMLYGNDIDDTTTPLEAGLGWTVKLDGADFIGKEVLVKQKAEKPARRLVGLEMVGKGIPRQGYPIYFEGEEVGKVTSGTFAPTLKKNLALCYVPRKAGKKGTKLEVGIRKRRVEAVVIKTPFYKRPQKG